MSRTYTVTCECGQEVTDTSFQRLVQRAWKHTGPSGLCPITRAREIINKMVAERWTGGL